MGNTSGKPHARSRHKKQVHWKAAGKSIPTHKRQTVNLYPQICRYDKSSLEKAISGRTFTFQPIRSDDVCVPSFYCVNEAAVLCRRSVVLKKDKHSRLSTTINHLAFPTISSHISFGCHGTGIGNSLNL